MFVANRVQQIKNHSSPSQWHHITTDKNPADIASRDIQDNNLVHNHMWFNGPSFLWELNLPLSENVVPSLGQNDPEVKKTQSFLVDQREKVLSFPTLLERMGYFSSWYRSKRASALCLRLKMKLRQGSVRISAGCDIKQRLSSYEPVSVEEVREAEHVICKTVQAVSFKDDIEHLKRLKIVNNPTSREEVSQRHKALWSSFQLYRLDPFIDTKEFL